MELTYRDFLADPGLAQRQNGIWRVLHAPKFNFNVAHRDRGTQCLPTRSARSGHDFTLAQGCYLAKQDIHFKWFGHVIVSAGLH